MIGPVIRRCLHAIVLVALLLSLAAVPGDAESVTAAAGDEIPLSGTAEGADEIYLFVTGPNLPANGARLDDIGAGVVTGDPASFTRAAVADGQWHFTWNTRTAGGVPDAGTYTVYVVREPIGRRDLGETTYASITVVLTRAGLDATIGEAGTLAVRSVPEGAEVRVDGVLQGTTPVDLTGVPAGTHTLELRKAGYATVNESIEIEAGTTTEIARELEERTPSPTLSPEETACECESPPAVGLSLLPALASLAIGSCARAARRAMTR
jgi:hypothetical protein